MTRRKGGMPAQQREVAAELLSRATGLHSRTDAHLIIDHLEALFAEGESAGAVIRWLSLLPKARGKQELRVQVQQVFLAQIDVSVPTALPKPAPVRKRPATAACEQCGDEFVMNARGRIALRCPACRKPSAAAVKRQAETTLKPCPDCGAYECPNASSS